MSEVNPGTLFVRAMIPSHSNKAGVTDSVEM